MYFLSTMAEPYASTGWSDLPIDLLIHVLHLLELPEALAFRAVCPLWRSASTTVAGVPCTRQAPWLVSVELEDKYSKDQSRNPWDPSVSSRFHRLLDEQAYQVSLAQVKAVALCGASHGWLVVANELSSLVLYDPFAMTTIPLPPITTFSNCIEGVYDDNGDLEGYRYMFYRGGDSIYDMASPGRYFYDKVVLSSSPSESGAIALAVHLEGKRLSFARVGGSSWHQVSRIQTGSRDSFADIVHHHGRFYTLTMKGTLVSLDFCGRRKPEEEIEEEMIIAAEDDNDSSDVITRYLVSTPWGHLLQVRVIFDGYPTNRVRVEIDRVDLKSRRMVGLSPTKALQGHTLFLGQNSSGVLSTNEFPELRPNCIYFTTPRLRNDNTYRRRQNSWSGVKVYDLRNQRADSAFRSGVGYYRAVYPSEVWFTPSQLPYRTFSISLDSLYK
ncbi:unnamed protein product [Alopecurus aequalis]